MCPCVYVSMCPWVYVSMCLCVYVSMCLCVHVSMCLHFYVYLALFPFLRPSLFRAFSLVVSACLRLCQSEFLHGCVSIQFCACWSSVISDMYISNMTPVTQTCLKYDTCDADMQSPSTQIDSDISESVCVHMSASVSLSFITCLVAVCCSV